MPKLSETGILLLVTVLIPISILWSASLPTLRHKPVKTPAEIVWNSFIVVESHPSDRSVVINLFWAWNVASSPFDQGALQVCWLLLNQAILGTL
ncbi:hypothetical protein F5J12DRAFT_298266 [Pisolithus orientalis]|uniref:uncharacterized protein n=1 Tax=Pisolithus orientalis TaxID=936130 RepID=UPI00222465AF|nr:uncharacterized protein F5J12DRAFT_298266 [Pisolithus orientalis]KAI6030563.1 hypothetical protein F5J12DRAFT_298266 [Pisolithus orientalis]